MRAKKLIESQLSEDEIKEAKLEALLIKQAIDSLKESIAQEVNNILETKKMGFNDLKRELDISSATLAKIVKGEGNVTLETVALLSAVSGKRPFITWK